MKHMQRVPLLIQFQRAKPKINPNFFGAFAGYGVESPVRSRKGVLGRGRLARVRAAGFSQWAEPFRVMASKKGKNMIAVFEKKPKVEIHSACEANLAVQP